MAGILGDVGSIIGGKIAYDSVDSGYQDAIVGLNKAKINADNPWEDYTEDPAAKQYQTAALQNLARVSAPGGDIQAKADMQENLGRAAASTRGSNLQALNQQAAMGTVGGGQLLASAAGAGQNQAIGSAAGTSMAAGQGYVRGLQAIAQMGQQAGQARGQEQQFQANKRGGTSAINQFNANQQLQKATTMGGYQINKGKDVGKIGAGIAQGIGNLGDAAISLFG